jgi:ABC-type proline/glycine betaine transport system permease subunit
MSVRGRAGRLALQAVLPVGLVALWHTTSADSTSRFYPPLLLPVAIVTIGIGNTSKVFVIALGSVWPILLSTTAGVRGVDPEVVEMARSFGLDPAQRVRRVVLAAASPRSRPACAPPCRSPSS